MNYFTLTPEVSIEKLGSDINTGLSEKEVEARQKKHGKNILPQEKSISPFKILLSHILDPMILLLVFAAVTTLVIQHYQDFYIILIVIILELAIGFVEEHRSSKIVEQLLKYSKTLARVIRNGEEQKILSEELVPGDIIVLSQGQKVPADARVLSTEYLMVDESILTGESGQIEKNSKLIDESTPLNQRTNMLFHGAHVTSGTVVAIVTGTGANTEFGKISSTIQKIKKNKTPLQKRLANFTKIFAIIVVVFIVVFMGVGLYLGKPLADILLLAISISVSAIPEGFPIIVSVALVVAVARMAKKKVIIKHLPSVETLGSTSIICMDKTGTLTENKLSVKKVVMPDGKEYDLDKIDYSPEGNFLLENKKVQPIQEPGLELLLTAGVLCNDSSIKKVDDEWNSIGDPTEAALIALAAKANLDPDKLHEKYKREHVVPFRSGHNHMITVNHSEEDKKRFIFIKGSPEKVLEFCSYKAIGDKTIKLSPKEKKDILENVEKLASKSYRVLAIAYKEAASQGDFEFSDTNLKYGVVFQGLIAMVDPIRSTAKQSLAEAKQAGLKVIIITGDHPATATNIARSLGMKIEDENVLTGIQFSEKTEKQFSNIADDILIYARVLPEQKMKIIEYWQQKGEVVAMTGDGINDAPALKRADIGISMGNGADIAKEASEIILLENDFSRIVDTIRQGRIVYDNIKKSILYLLGHNIGEVGVILVAILTGLPLPLIPTQILWMNLVTDGVIDESLIFEPGESGIMQRTPRKSNEKFLDSFLIRRTIVIGVVVTVVSYLVFQYYYANTTLEYSRTMVFTLMAFFSVFGVMSSRTLHTSIFKHNFFSNHIFLYTAVLTLCLQLVVVYIPRLNEMFQTVPLKLSDLLLMIPLSATLLLFVELEKFVTRNFSKKTIA